MSKYGNKITFVDGIKFHSAKEARRYRELKLLERAGHITDLRRQVKYVLWPTIYDDDGKLLFHGRNYYADFVYRDRSGKIVVEDCKGFRTEVYKMKAALMYLNYHIKVLET